MRDGEGDGLRHILSSTLGFDWRGDDGAERDSCRESGEAPIAHVWARLTAVTLAAGSEQLSGLLDVLLYTSPGTKSSRSLRRMSTVSRCCTESPYAPVHGGRPSENAGLAGSSRRKISRMLPLLMGLTRWAGAAPVASADGGKTGEDASGCPRPSREVFSLFPFGDGFDVFQSAGGHIED